MLAVRTRLVSLNPHGGWSASQERAVSCGGLSTGSGTTTWPAAVAGSGSAVSPAASWDPESGGAGAANRGGGGLGRLGVVRPEGAAGAVAAAAPPGDGGRAPGHGQPLAPEVGEHQRHL